MGTLTPGWQGPPVLEPWWQGIFFMFLYFFWRQFIFFELFSLCFFSHSLFGRERVSQLTSDRAYSSFASESIPRQTSSDHTQKLSTWHQETGNDKKSPPNGKETVYNENSIVSEEMNKWQCQ